jgi:hypothetical protein
MKEFMLLIKTEGNAWTLPQKELDNHLEKVVAYIEDLMKSGNFKSAQPLAFEGAVISGTQGKLKDGPFNESKEVIAGYYLILAKDLDDAIQIGKRNPIFEIALTAKLEVRPIVLQKGIND